MNNNLQEKSLIKVNENSIFYKIRKFFKRIFLGKSNKNEIIMKENEENMMNNNDFLQTVTKTENEETLLLKLQKQYRKGEIKEEELTEQQIVSLCELYDRQIEKLKKSNEIRKKKILEYRKRIQE